MALYTGTCGALTEVVCNDNAVLDGEDSAFSNAYASGLTPGATLYVRVWTVPFGPTNVGPFNVCAVSVPRRDAGVRIIYALGKWRKRRRRSLPTQARRPSPTCP